MTGAELAARRTAAAAVLADYRAALASAPVTRPPGREWMLRLADTLGDLLGALGPAVVLDHGQAVTVLSALEDASEGIRERAANCPDCDTSPADLCDECSDRLARADAYDRLAGQLRQAT
ncbi:MAG TPA: hypothetical protein VIX86_04665 [Streptosporangiaceae bacterium]